MFHKIKWIALLVLVVILPACKKEVENSKRTVLVLGNSMTIHAPSVELGWYGNWGMAASSKDKDYVHILETKLQMPVVPVNISAWERNHTTFDLSTLDT
ncbi:MAG: SGNH/GDSL hydrolase family protein, partial [Pedobacter sp.]